MTSLPPSRFSASQLHARRVMATSTRYFCFIILIGMVVFLTACTGYRSYGVFGGFGEQKLSNNIYHVYVLGNGYTSQERVANLALLRAADIALQNNMNYFVISRKDAGDINPQATTQITSNTKVSTLVYQGHKYYLTSPSSDNIVILFKTQPNVANNVIYNAQKICDTLGKDYVAKCGDNKIQQ